MLENRRQINGKVKQEIIVSLGSIPIADELLDENIYISIEDRFYRFSDTLLKVQPELEKYLRNKEQDLIMW